ncbi:RagB/SusD family nutrient uptake outer membrane protein [Niabella hibiscisoli]|uniref:RagB/SusD family nutrient uptake outer membrane protein n=1 Tax=Niabella hibiscisoli TaxID=1825928 RepID=UPI001F0FFBA6|nr:RagB/SusD family nutrient uptake outer membrane protein [Niabella hibiscisoli]MCH5720810.1 RagB/SusD family nutrient uptake outer membrane protein [Niabella hibiscisoli]
MYDGIQAIFDNDYTLYGDARTDEIRVGQYGNISYAMNGLSAGITGSDWTNFYITIARANLGIKYIPIVKQEHQTGIAQSAINHYLAQCYTTRALCYFWLIRLWGMFPYGPNPTKISA